MALTDLLFGYLGARVIQNTWYLVYGIQPRSSNPNLVLGISAPQQLIVGAISVTSMQDNKSLWVQVPIYNEDTGLRCSTEFLRWLGPNNSLFLLWLGTSSHC